MQNLKQNSQRRESSIRSISLAVAYFFNFKVRRRYTVLFGALALLSFTSSLVQPSNSATAQLLSPLATKPPISDSSLVDFADDSDRCIRMNFRDRVVESYRPLPPAGDMTQHLPYEKNRANHHTMESSYYARPYQAVGFASSSGADLHQSVDNPDAFDAAEQDVRSLFRGASHEGYLEFSDWRRQHQLNSQPFIR